MQTAKLNGTFRWEWWGAGENKISIKTRNGTLVPLQSSDDLVPHFLSLTEFEVFRHHFSLNKGQRNRENYDGSRELCFLGPQSNFVTRDV